MNIGAVPDVSPEQTTFAKMIRGQPLKTPGVDYETLKADCLRTGRLYEDPDFPAVNKSIFFSKPLRERVYWKRPLVSSKTLSLAGVADLPMFSPFGPIVQGTALDRYICDFIKVENSLNISLLYIKIHRQGRSTPCVYY